MSSVADDGGASERLNSFTDLVRDALLHLYDTAYLQTHELARLRLEQAAAGSISRGRLLVRALLDAIEMLRPSTGTAERSPAWRSYRILTLRYIEGLSVGEVADRLAISKTQYRRDHARALEAIALALGDRLGFPADHPTAVPPDASREALASREARWLAERLVPEHINLTSLLGELATLLDPICVENAIQLTTAVSSDAGTVFADRVAVRQILLVLLNAGLAAGPGTQVNVTVHPRGPRSEVRIAVALREGIAPPLGAFGPLPFEIEAIGRLAQATGGSLTLEPEPMAGSWTAVLRLPHRLRSMLLVIDNHADFISLIGRYLAAHRWEVVGATTVESGKSQAASVHPDAILLDVMMPGQDGWDLLLALRSHPETRLIPVIICSVLYEPRIAQALGAVAYLPKPINQSRLLEALESLPAAGYGSAPDC